MTGDQADTAHCGMASALAEAFDSIEDVGMAAALGRLDAMVVNGGVGERAPEVRQAVADRLPFLGVEVDPPRNDNVEGDAVVCPPGTRTATLVVSNREDLEIARQIETIRQVR